MSDSLTFETYQLGAAETAVYPEAGESTWVALSYLGLGLGEAGEVQGKLKKIVRDDGGVVTDSKREALAGELGDVLWYVANLAGELGLGLEDIAQANLDKLNSRKERGVLAGSGDNR